MRLNYLIAVVLLLLVSCNTFYKKKPYQIVNKYSKLNFDEGNINAIEFEDHTSGIKEEGIMQGIFKMVNVNLDSLQKELIDLGYKRLPMKELERENGFNDNVQDSDSGYYHLTLLHRSIIDELVIFNFTQNKVIIYKLKS